jgi:hypothetical protein
MHFANLAITTAALGLTHFTHFSYADAQNREKYSKTAFKLAQRSRQGKAAHAAMNAPVISTREKTSLIGLVFAVYKKPILPDYYQLHSVHGDEVRFPARSCLLLI